MISRQRQRLLYHAGTSAGCSTVVPPPVKTARSEEASCLHDARSAGSRHSMRSTGALMLPRRRSAAGVRRSPSHGSGSAPSSCLSTCSHGSRHSTWLWSTLEAPVLDDPERADKREIGVIGIDGMRPTLQDHKFCDRRLFRSDMSQTDARQLQQPDCSACARKHARNLTTACAESIATIHIRMSCLPDTWRRSALALQQHWTGDCLPACTYTAYDQ